MSNATAALVRAIVTPAITGSEAEIIGFGKQVSRAELSKVGANYPDQVLNTARQFHSVAAELPDLVAAATEMKMLNDSFV